MLDDVELVTEYGVAKPVHENRPGAFAVATTAMLAIKARLSTRIESKNAAMRNAKAYIELVQAQFKPKSWADIDESTPRHEIVRAAT